MTTRHYLGEHTTAILSALSAGGPMNKVQLAAVTGIDPETVRTYLRRCAFRGLATVDREARPPIFAAAPGWEAFCVTKRPPDKPARPRPDPISTVALARMTQPNSVFALGAM